jgi:hypothetical protein
MNNISKRTLENRKTRTNRLFFINLNDTEDEEYYDNNTEYSSEDFSEEENEIIEEDCCIFSSSDNSENDDNDDYVPEEDDINMVNNNDNVIPINEIFNEEEEEEKNDEIDFEELKITPQNFNLSCCFNYSKNQWKKILNIDEKQQLFNENKEKSFFYENLFGFKNNNNNKNNENEKIPKVMDFFIILINLKIKYKITIPVMNIIINIFQFFPNINKNFPKNWESLKKKFLFNFPKIQKKISICGCCNTHIFENEYKNFKNENLNNEQKKFVECPLCHNNGFKFNLKKKKWKPKNYIYHFSIVNIITNLLNFDNDFINLLDYNKNENENYNFLKTDYYKILKENFDSIKFNGFKIHIVGCLHNDGVSFHKKGINKNVEYSIFF